MVLLQHKWDDVWVMFKTFHWLPRKVKVAQLCLTPCNPMDYTVHGILQARILKWVAFLFSGGSSQLKDWTQVSCITDRFFTNWATGEVHRENDIQIYEDLQDFTWSFYCEFSPNSILVHLPYNSLISSFLRTHQDIIFVFSSPQILFPPSNCSMAHSLPLWFILYIWVTE